MNVCSRLTSREIAQTVELLSKFISPERLFKFKEVISSRNTARIILENISNYRNASACLRTADGFGVHNVDVIDIDQKFRVDKEISTCGDKWLSLHNHQSSANCIMSLKEKGYYVLVGCLGRNSKPLNTLELSGRQVAVVFGNETRGASESTIRMADSSFIIPMTGFVQSFNISVALGIVLWHLKTQGCLDGRLVENEQTRLLADFLIRDVSGAHMLLKNAGIYPGD